MPTLATQNEPMPSNAARRLQPDEIAPKRGPAAPLDGRALEALARLKEELSAPGDRRAGRDRRGPLRPGELMSPRRRFDGRSAVRLFRGADVVLAAGLAAAALAMGAPGGLLGASLGAALPFLAAVAALIVGLRAVGAYDFGAREDLPAHLLKTSAAFVPAVAVLALAGLPPGAHAPLAPLALWLALTFACVYLGHALQWMAVHRWREKGRLTPNIVVVGATRNAERLIAGLLESREAFVLGVFDDRAARAPTDICGVPVLGDTRALIGHRVTPYVDKVVITVPASAQSRVRQLIESLRVLPNEISLFLDFDAAGRAAAASRLADAPMARLSGEPRDDRRAFSKRAQDLVIGSLAMIVAAPVMALIALAIRLDSPGPVFFRQRRHGFNNEEITVWKFRSMRADAADATASRQVSVGDDRVTRVGRFIRRTSLDELPQLVNVLKGEMSLVGPRPHAIGMKTGEVESARLVAEYAHRHRLKPGLTGWAAIKGSRGPVDTPELVRRRVALDVEYIERQSFWLDLYIMAMTIPCLLGDSQVAR